MTVEEFKTRLSGGRHDGREVVVLGVPFLVAVSPAGDVETIEEEQAGDAIALGHSLYKFVDEHGQGSDFRLAYCAVGLHEVMKIVSG